MSPLGPNYSAKLPGMLSGSKLPGMLGWLPGMPGIGVMAESDKLRPLRKLSHQNSSVIRVVIVIQELIQSILKSL